jgi:peptidoglycan/LPS O-acetylase OafA/YrhL
MNNKFLGDPSHQGTTPAPRIHYFDWLRAIAVFGVVAYHTALTFSRELPVYILYFPVAIGISALVVEWSLGFGAKLSINLVLGVGATVLVSAIDLRIAVLRLLLDLHRPRPSVVHRRPATHRWPMAYRAAR